MRIPHVLALPYPAQGHVIPMLELMRRFAQHGIKVTFVNTDFNHRRVTNALQGNNDLGENIDMVSIPDGLEPWEDRNDIRKLQISIELVMPNKLDDLIEKINEATDENKITCVIADLMMGWGLDVARNMGIKQATFWPASAAILALIHSIPKLIDDGLVNKEDGTLTKSEMFHPLPSLLPVVNSKTFIWACFDDEAIRKTCFKLLVDSIQFMKLADFIICNSAYELEPAAFSVIPKVLPIGPLAATSIPGNKAGNFWPEDLSCLSWLDQQPARSVIYVAFGSFTVFDPTQFQELALGLELTNKPFLWVVRPDITTDTKGGYPDGFQDRIGNRGNLVGWAPQQKVLSHPSVACFMSHCGWNSTTEGVSNGVPFLCWPYFADQLANQNYICDVWNIGLRFEKDDTGIVRKDEIVKKVEQLLSDNNYKVRTMELKEKVVTSVQEDGCSNKNFSNFITWMK